MNIKTNNIPRMRVSWYDLPEKAQADFDYLDDDRKDDSRFCEYKGQWYDVFDMMRLENTGDWQAGEHHTAFTGVVVKIIATCYSADTIFGSYTC